MSTSVELVLAFIPLWHMPMLLQHQAWMPTATSFPIRNCNGFPASSCGLPFPSSSSSSCHIHTFVSHFFQCLRNHKVNYDCSFTLWGECPYKLHMWALMTLRSSHYNITSNIFGIACSRPIIVWDPPPHSCTYFKTGLHICLSPCTHATSLSPRTPYA